MKFIHVLLIISTIWSCSNDDDKSNNFQLPTTMGLNYSTSTANTADTFTKIISALNQNENIGIVAEINHASNAAAAGLELRDTRVVLFGNPNLGTPLMQENQMAGLDLPQKMIVYNTEDDSTIVAYNSVEYLANRHGLSAATLPTIATALKNLASNASGSDVNEGNSDDVALGEGIKTVTSTQDFETTYNTLVSAIEGNSNLILVAQLNHQANAERVGLELNPTRLIVFGNPNLGSPLMQSSQTTSIDLPQKMLVWQNDADQVFISYNSADFIAERHGLNGVDSQLETISGALRNLANAAAGL